MRRRAHRPRRERTFGHRRRGLFRPPPDGWQGQFELPFGTVGPMTLLTLGTLRFLRDRGLDRDDPGAGRGRATRLGGAQPARAAPRSDHRRRGARRAARRVPLHATDVLRRHRRRRCGRGDVGRTGARPPSTAGARARHRRGQRRRDGEPDARPHVVGRVPPGRRGRVRRRRARARRHRPRDAVRRRRHPSADGARGPRLRAARRVGRVRRRRSHRDRWVAAGEHQRRRTQLHAQRHVRHVRAAGVDPAAPRGGAPRRSTASRTSLTHAIGGMFQAAATVILGVEPVGG